MSATQTKTGVAESATKISAPVLVTPTLHDDESPAPSSLAAAAALRELNRLDSIPLSDSTANGALEADLRKWSDRHWTEDGLLLSAPWSTPRILPAMTRLRARLRETNWSDDFERKFARLVEATVRLGCGNGWIRSEPASFESADRQWLQMVLAEKQFRPLREPAEWIWTLKRRGASRKPALPGFQSDAASVALLRRDWTATPTYLAIDYSRPTFDAIFCIDGQPILQPSWEVEVRCSDKPLKQLGEWENSCWFADIDGDYAEFRRIFGGGVVLERQLYLSRRLGFLLLTDTVKSSLYEPLELTWRWPLAKSLEATKEPETSSLQLRNAEGRRVRFLPFGWPSGQPGQSVNAASACQVDVVHEHLTVRAATVGKRLFVPSIVHWGVDASDPMPPSQPCSLLTVTNDRRRVAPDEAVAYRIPLEGEQFVFFRALCGLERYAFLGYQTRAECVLGDFDKNGKLHEWVNVE